ncbi:tyrosine-type recombinase/integrase [Sporichthya sp.]|uniref:tyrosine-type recombinase/integrase n=1 Tax=Sporichthya sp. TaxID=65475 RepID=UPI0017D285C5|nr:tyrosine-type recombinase/integrase [Sporichthya sp.]MBA3743959.1 tyrosine-type recombinase/integrase [Sporichthya sp.]
MATKKRRARGHIEERPNGAFRAIVFAGADAISGRDRYIKRTAPTRGEAEKLLTKLQNEVDERRHSRASITVSAAVEQWLEVTRHEASTRERYDQLIRLYINPVLGKLQLAALDPETLEKLYARLLNCRELCNGPTRASHECAPLSPNTVRKIHFILRATLDRAVRWNYVAVNGAALAQAPAFGRSEPDPPTAEEARALLDEAARDPEWALMLFLTMTLGWRRGEICALRWSDVDLAGASITIERSHWGLLEKKTKTNQRRRVALDPYAVEQLTAYKDRCAVECAAIGVRLSVDAFVFSSAPDRSTPLLPHSITQRYGRLATTVGLRSKRLHSLRHYSASELIAFGARQARSAQSRPTQPWLHFPCGLLADHGRSPDHGRRALHPRHPHPGHPHREDGGRRGDARRNRR